MLTARALYSLCETKSTNPPSVETFQANEFGCKVKTLYFMKQIFGKKYYRKVNFN